MTLQEWLDEAAASGQDIALQDTPHGQICPAQQVRRTLDSATLAAPVQVTMLDELYRSHGLRGIIAQVPDGRYWVRFVSHPDAAATASQP